MIDPSVAATTAGVVVALLLGLVGIPISWRSAQAARQSAAEAKASREIAARQLEAAQQAQLDAATPYVWVDIRPVDGSRSLSLVVGNSGPTVAQHVRVVIEPPLERFIEEEFRHMWMPADAALRRGLASLAPGRQFEFPIGSAIAFYPTDGSPEGAPAFTVRVTAEAWFGPIAPLEYVIALEDMGSLALRTSPALRTAEAVEKLFKPLDKVADSAQSIDHRQDQPAVESPPAFGRARTDSGPAPSNPTP